MELTPELIDRLQTILKKKWGLTASKKEANEIGTNWVKYYDHLDQIQHRSSQHSLNDSQP